MIPKYGITFWIGLSFEFVTQILFLFTVTKNLVCWCSWSSWGCWSSRVWPTSPRRTRRTRGSSPCHRYDVTHAQYNVKSKNGCSGKVLWCWGCTHQGRLREAKDCRAITYEVNFKMCFIDIGKLNLSVMVWFLAQANFLLLH